MVAHLSLVCAVAVCLAVVGPSAQAAGVQKAEFGKLADGTVVDLYTLTNGSGMVAKITTYGGIVTELLVPDRKGRLGDVVLGFDNLDGYLKGHPYFGALIGRVGNRIAKGKFKLDGKEYTLAVNNGPNALHGGIKGFDKVVWKAKILKRQTGPALSLTYLSKDGEEGYPGNLKVTVIYSLTDRNELKIEYRATTDRATPVNLTNHSYFNLTGSQQADGILGERLMIAAAQYTPVDDTLIPTGEIASVCGTPLDFTRLKTIGSRISDMKGNPGGYDHNFVLDSDGGKLALAAVAEDRKSGRVMEMLTTEPGVQFYTGNFLDGTLTGKGGVVYQKHQAFCLEAQHYPDSVNHPQFPAMILRPGQVYKQTTVYRFSVY